jgi:hypothetical protein
MNYVSAVYAVVVFIIAVDWLSRGRREYRGQTDRHEAAEETLRKASIVSFGHGAGTGVGGEGSVGHEERRSGSVR